MKHSSQTYRCLANHNSWIYPTDALVGLPNLEETNCDHSVIDCSEDKDKDSADETSIDDNVQPPPVCENTPPTFNKNHYPALPVKRTPQTNPDDACLNTCDHCDHLRKKMKELQKQVSNLTKRNEELQH